MQHTKTFQLGKYRIFILLAAIVSFLIFALPTKAQFDGVCIIKLYSGDNLVATWPNAQLGQIEGNSYVFTQGAQKKEVRISGTYSVEVIR